MKNTPIFVSILLFFSLLSLKAETPQEGAQAIHKLLIDQDYSTLFKERYSEWYKVEKEGVAPKVAIEKLSKRWKKQHEVFLSVYEQLGKAEYVMGKNDHIQESETGDTATTKIEIGGREMPFSLYKMKNGKWGFHL